MSSSSGELTWRNPVFFALRRTGLRVRTRR
jgi:hypothetical protein